MPGRLLRDPARFSTAYRSLLHAARAEGIGPARLPDFLGLEHGGDLALLSQEELDISVSGVSGKALAAYRIIRLCYGPYG